MSQQALGQPWDTLGQPANVVGQRVAHANHLSVMSHHSARPFHSPYFL